MTVEQSIKLYFLHGTERFLINTQLKKLLSVDPTKQNTQLYDCTNRSLKECLIDLYALLHNKSLFTNLKKIIVIKNLWLLKPDNVKLLRLITPPKHSLIFVEYQKTLAWHKLFPQLTQAYQERIYSFKTRGAFRLWAQDYLKEQRISCDSNALYRLLQLSQHFNNQRLTPAPGIFVNLVQKLQLLFPNTTLGIDHLDKLDPGNVNTTIWELLELSFSNKKDRQKHLLQKLIRQRTDPMFIFNLLLDNLRVLLVLRHLLDKNTPITKVYLQMNRLNKKRFSVDKALQMLGRNTKLNFSKLSILYSKIALLDHKVKRGSLDIGTVLELLLIRF